ncbi:MAG: hypothetical protein U0183_24610 [Polyangiaceae bacterium]
MPLRRSPCWSGLVVLLAVSAGSGCAGSEPRRLSVKHAESPMPVAAAPEVRPPADVAALTAALEAAAQTVEVRLDTKGRVLALEVRQWERAAAFVNSSPEPYVRAFVKAHGDRFGYGPLGEGSDDIALNDEVLGSPASLLVPYPKAQGCPGLAVLFRYTYGHDVTGLVGMPLSWEVLCPTEPGALHRIQEARERAISDVAGSRAVTAALKDEPIVQWLVDHGFGRPTMVAREKDQLRVGLRHLGGPETRTPEALAREVAERAAEVSKLPKLDKITVRYREGGKSRPKRIAGVELSASRASGGLCVDPRVIVSLRETADETEPPSVEEVTVVCPRESVGESAPADSERRLPRTFATSPEYLVHCRSTNYAWGYSNTGLVVDRRGDVYSYSGGQPTQGTTVSALAAQLKNGKAFHGTLPAADVERLVALIPKIAQEKWKSQAQAVFDGPEGECAYLRAGASPGALVRVPIDSYSNHHTASREGEATRAAAAILGRAETLKARGR